MTKRKDPNIDSRRKSMKDHPNFKGNKYEQIDNETYVGKDSKGNIFYIEVQDYATTSHYCWSATGRASKIGKYFGARTSRNSEFNHKMIMLHNFIWEQYNGNIPKNKLIDHIDQNPANCKLSNLRLADATSNARNSPMRSDNTSGVIGVGMNRNRWRSYIALNGKQMSLGSFQDKEDAIKARLRGELKYFGEFAPQRHLFEEYGIEVCNGE